LRIHTSMKQRSRPSNCSTCDPGTICYSFIFINYSQGTASLSRLS
jgi:hypothetical protein